MSGQTSCHSLPSLPPLPPLELPQPDSSTVPLVAPLPVDSGLVPSSHSPAALFPPKNSFTTAFTSSSSSDASVGHAISSKNAPPLVPPQSLRKSISVDSFVQYGRESPSSGSTRADRGNAGPAFEPLIFGVPAGMGRDREQRVQSGRPRGDSVSTVHDDLNTSVIADSDLERSDPLYKPSESFRRASLKGHGQSRPFVPAGELPLPSRTLTLSSTSSLGNVSAYTSSTRQENLSRLQSASSLQAMPRRGSNSSMIGTSGRSRSGSLGMYAPNNGRRMLVNTHFSENDTFSQNAAVTLHVVGAPGCGKSTVIRKGLKSYSLSEPSAFFVSSGRGAVPMLARCTLRKGRINHSENTPSCPLHVIEVDASTFNIDPGSSKGTIWPEGSPRIDGVIICYDASDEVSFRPVERLLRGYCAMKLPTIVLACKFDLERQVEPEMAHPVLQQYDVGLVEVTSAHEAGKEKMRRSFDWLLKAVFRHRRTTRNEIQANYRNPASPDVLISPPPWENSRTTTPTAPSSISPTNAVGQTHTALSRVPQSPVSAASGRSLATPNSPTRARSTGDLLYEHEKSKSPQWQVDKDISESRSIVNLRNNSADSLREPAPAVGDGLNGVNGTPEDHKEVKEKESRPAQWATLEELLDKLLFLAVSGDDPTYITHFLLTYRRFASPRSVLLAMQKRMRQLDNPSGDPMFACFAQMRICHLLELWIRDYPYDFAVRGTAGALSALIKSIISKTYLLHYGSDFLPFLELLPNLEDKDAHWALKVEDLADESDDSYSLLDEDDDSTQISETESPIPGAHSPTSTKQPDPSLPAPSRERKSSLPLMSMRNPLSAPTLNSAQSETLETMTPNQHIKKLVKLAQEVNLLDSDEIAQEFTRLETELFLNIEPRHWLQYTFVSGKKVPRSDSITRLNEVSNNIADWVVSLILCHDKAKARAKQIEKLVEVAQRLRALNNYSALRAFVAGINNSTFPGDQTMEQFKAKSPDQAKLLQSWDVLLQHIRSHRAYRLALRNTKGGCIPALEVHISDLIRAHEGNPDVNPSDPTKVHWGKYNMIGRFITSTTQYQAQCRTAPDYNFPKRTHISDLLYKEPMMNEEMQKSRIAPPDIDAEDGYRPTLYGTMSRDNQTTNIKDVARLRKLFFW